MFIIDLQPFLNNHPGITHNQTKGFNTPLYLARGLIPGAYCYRDEHSKDPDLIKYRTAIIEKVISGAERNKLNDVGGYLKGNMDNMLNYWKVQLKLLNIPEHYQDNLLTRIGSIKDDKRYGLAKDFQTYVRVSGMEI